MNDIPKPREGGLTFDAEGQEGGPWHSRRLHVPGPTSGVTVGRGYDVKARTYAEVRRDLESCGIAEAEVIAAAVQSAGDQAEEYIEQCGLESHEITPEQQVALFDLDYPRYVADTRRLCEKADVVKAYGETDWDALHPAIREVLVDLRYRGDYTPSARRIVQAAVAANDLNLFTNLMCDRHNWPNVPQDRFRRRADFMLDQSQPQEG